MASCMSGGEPLVGLAMRPLADAGPTIYWPEQLSWSEIPFPNDILTRPEADSPTGRRLNFSAQGVTHAERSWLQSFSELDGFSTYAPLWLRFEPGFERIDLADLEARHANRDTSDDAIFLVNLNRYSENFGQVVPLEMGRGRFPLNIEDFGRYFPSDPRRNGGNLLFETVAEDNNDDGVLDTGEDTDGDGVLDQPNTWRVATGVPRNPGPLESQLDLISFYELESETLSARPIFPLEERTVYAVVVTRRLRGAQSHSPVRSPFVAIHHLQQTDELRPLTRDGILESLGLSLQDVAFAWTFTTQTTHSRLVELRDGIYGRGKYAALSGKFPAEVTSISHLESKNRSNNVYTLASTRLLEALSKPIVANVFGLELSRVQPLLDAYRDFVDYLVDFTITVPVVLGPDVSDQAVSETLPISCMVPKARAGHSAPFPVVFYSHSFSYTRWEFMGFASNLARFGLATCALDFYGHGVPSSDLIDVVVQQLLEPEELTGLGDAVVRGRSRDLNQDGATDSGGDMFSHNPFVTRDLMLQSALDSLFAIRTLKNFGSSIMPFDVNGDGLNELAGDFNGDGVADLGANRPYYLFGSALGGMLDILVGAVEPAVQASAAASAGAGWQDIFARSSRDGLIDGFFLNAAGPLIVAAESTTTQNRIELSLETLDVLSNVSLRFATAPDPIHGIAEAFAEGDRVVARNLDNGAERALTLSATDDDGKPATFRFHLPSDFGDRFDLRFYRQGASQPYRVINTFELPSSRLSEVGFLGARYVAGSPLRVLQSGLGLQRQTPEWRRYVGLAQMALDAADPINYAPLYLSSTQDLARSLFVVNIAGDQKFPVSAGVALARTAGAITYYQADPVYQKSQDEVLLDAFVPEGLDHMLRFANDPCHNTPNAVLFDIDFSDQGLGDQIGPRLPEIVRPADCASPNTNPQCLVTCSAVPPLRATNNHNGATLATRFLYKNATGTHAFSVPDTTVVFDYDSYQINQIAWFLATEDHQVRDDVCFATYSCPFFTP